MGQTYKLNFKYKNSFRGLQSTFQITPIDNQIFNFWVLVKKNRPKYYLSGYVHITKCKFLIQHRKNASWDNNGSYATGV